MATATQDKVEVGTADQVEARRAEQVEAGKNAKRSATRVAKLFSDKKSGPNDILRRAIIAQLFGNDYSTVKKEIEGDPNNSVITGFRQATTHFADNAEDRINELAAEMIEDIKSLQGLTVHNVTLKGGVQSVQMAMEALNYKPGKGLRDATYRGQVFSDDEINGK